MIGEKTPGQGTEAEHEVHGKPQLEDVLEAHVQRQRERDGERREGDLVEVKEKMRRHGEEEDLLFVADHFVATRRK